VAEKEKRAGKGRAIGIGSVSSTGDNLGTEATCYRIEARLREDDSRVARVGTVTHGHEEHFLDLQVIAKATAARVIATPSIAR
jgi:hypothetical protein